MRNCGLDMEVVTVPEKGAVTGRSIAEIETMGQGKFFVLQVERKDGGHITNPERALQCPGGDGVVIVGRQQRGSPGSVRCAGEKVARRPHHVLGGNRRSQSIVACAGARRPPQNTSRRFAKNKRPAAP